MSRNKPLPARSSGIGWVAAFALIVVVIPLAVVGYQSRRQGLTLREYLFSSAAADPNSDPAERGPAVDFLVPEPIGDGFATPPKISYLEVADLDQDGLLDILVCDAEQHFVSWIRQDPLNVFTEQILADSLIAPAHLEVVDIDQDGDSDVLVAVLGMLYPNNDRIGSLVVLENKGEDVFMQRTLLNRVARVSDVRAGDLDGDGDLDLAVVQFGYHEGEVRWMENLGEWQFRSHLLQSLAGGIHGELADFDQDGALDLAVLISQDWEQVYIFFGNGDGTFREELVFDSDNLDFGSSGLWVHDLDQDGDHDILFCNGDAFDYQPPHPWPWHGVQWLENTNGEDFRMHRIAKFGGAVNAVPIDVEGDGDLDLIASSTFNDWNDPKSQSIILLRNLGAMRFRRHDITNTPSHVQALGLGDLDGDGDLDLVTGGMHVSKPFDRVERIVLWRNRGTESNRVVDPVIADRLE